MRKYGIDTMGLKICSGLGMEELKVIGGVLEENSSIREHYKYLCVKPSKVNKTNLSTKGECLEYLDFMKGAISGGIDVSRIDLAYDTKKGMGEDMKVYQLFLELLAIKRGTSGVFRTEKGLFKTGNLKISNSKQHTVVYDCSDKIRIANTRVEDRELDIRNNKSFDKVIDTSIDKRVKELREIRTNLNIYLEDLERQHITLIIRECRRREKKRKIGSFTEFIASVEDKILTKGILNGVYAEIMGGSPNGWLRDYRKTRCIEFVSKQQIRGFIKELENGFKELKKG